MTLLNGLLALGAMAFTIPLTIHLLFRSRFKTIQWGAMHLLDAVVRTNQRRLQITELLLLLVRCAIPILLAFALARPVLTGFRSLPGESAQTVVIAIDDSRSMSATNQAGQTAMQRCVEGLTDYLSRLSRRDEVMLITSSQAAKPVATMGRDEAIRRLREIKPSGNAANLGMLLRSAATALSDAANPQRRVVLVSDLRSSDVTDDVLRSFEPIERVLAAMEPAATPRPRPRRVPGATAWCRGPGAFGSRATAASAGECTCSTSTGSVRSIRCSRHIHPTRTAVAASGHRVDTPASSRSGTRWRFSGTR